MKASRLALLALALSFSAHQASLAQNIDPNMLKGMVWRNIGPFRGGRVSAVAGVMGETGTFYIGLPQGGVWKTTSGGQTWFPVFDSIKETSTVGAIAVAPSDANVVYAGTGEISGGGNGWGVYKSIDAGKTWQHLGLEKTKLIPSILVDPKDPNTVLVASRGRQSGKDDRGVFRSTDGGKTWTKTLFIDENTGVTHMAMAYDQPATVIAGVKGSGEGKTFITKSNDFGQTWNKVGGKGLPELRGRYSLAVAQNTNAKRMFVVGRFGLYRSDDGGDNWTQMAVGDNRIANGQGDYSSGVWVDTQNPDIVYTVATCVYKSTDGGKTFEGWKGAPGGDDPHFLWIDPSNGKRIILGGDQGATVSFDGGENWGSWYNQPTAQVYHISTDNQYPYWVYATQQDSGVVATASRGNYGQITSLDWSPHPGFEFGYVVVDPLNPKISYSLSMSLSICRVEYPSGAWVEAGPVSEPGDSLRAGIQIPLAFSNGNPHELIAGYQYLMATTDGGQHWHKLSPDLAAKPKPSTDPKAPPAFASKGYITSFSESRADSKVLWTGSTNGMVHVSADHGKTWTWCKTGLPEGNISCIEACHQDPRTAYVTFSGNEPRVFRTRDMGKTWTQITKGLPTAEPFGSSVSVVRADTVRKGLLFCGTNKQMFFSLDDGDNWQSLGLNLPTTVVSDLQIKNDDLVLGTYGRSFWILDDISPLRQMGAASSDKAQLFAPAVGVRVRRNVNGDTPFPPEIPHAENPPLGVSIYYTLGEKPKAPISLDILDESGRVVRHMSSLEPEPYGDPKPEVAPYWIGKRRPMPTELGLNRVNWNIRYDNPPAFVHDVQDVINAVKGDTPEAIEGPLALPGRYTARLTVDGKTYSSPLQVKNDPRSLASTDDLRKLHEVEMDVLACSNASWAAYNEIATARYNLGPALKSTVKEVADAAKAYDSKLASLQGRVSYSRRFFMGASASNFVDANIYMLTVLAADSTGDSAPSEAHFASYATCYYMASDLLAKLKDLNGKPLGDLNALMAKNGLAALKPVIVPGGLAEPGAKFRRKAGATRKVGQIQPPVENDGDDD